jgi:hypothetical protein
MMLKIHKVIYRLTRLLQTRWPAIDWPACLLDILMLTLGLALITLLYIITN